MTEKINIQKQLKNAAGKRINLKTKLEYAKEISESLKHHPEDLIELLECLDIMEEDLYRYLSGEQSANITFYDQALTHLVKKRKCNN